MSQSAPLPKLYDLLYRDATRIAAFAAQLEPVLPLSGRTDTAEAIAVHVLSCLHRSGSIRSDIMSAPHGALVHITGTLAWVDRSVLELAFLAFDVAIGQEELGRADPGNISMVKFLRTFLGKVPTPSAFLLQTAEGNQVAGTIQAAGVTDPISTHYFKHGNAGLADIHLVGIKELPSPTFSLPQTQLMGAGQQAAGALKEMLFPPEAVRITPVVIYRIV